MKRSAFIASALGFIGIGKAQEWKGYQGPCTEWATGGSPTGIPECKDVKPGKALNGQCPVCGTMAEPRKFQPGGVRQVPCPNQEESETTGVVCTHPTYYDPGPAITRCKRCNAAFWQDAEE